MKYRYKKHRTRPSLAQILDAAIEITGVSERDILSDYTGRRVSRARMAAMWAARFYQYSYPKIGGHFERHHSTVIAAIQRVDEAPETLEQARQIVEAMNRVREAWSASVEDLMHESRWGMRPYRGRVLELPSPLECVVELGPIVEPGEEPEFFEEPEPEPEPEPIDRPYDPNWRDDPEIAARIAQFENRF